MLLFVFRHITNVRTGEIKSEDHNAIGVRREVDTAESVRRGTYELKLVRIIARRGVYNLYLRGYLHGLFTMTRRREKMVSWLAEPEERRTRWRWETLGSTPWGGSGTELEYGSRVNTSTETESESTPRSTESRVNTSTETEPESTPRGTESRVNTSTGAESESTPRSTGSRVNTSTGDGIRVNTSEYGKSSQHLDQRRNPSQHLGRRKSSQHLDWSGIRVNTSDEGSRVNTSTGAESESTPRMKRKSSQHLDRSGARVSTSGEGSRLALESAPRVLGRGMVSTVWIGRLIYPGAAYGPSGVGVGRGCLRAEECADTGVSCMYRNSDYSRCPQKEKYHTCGAADKL